MLYSLPCYSIHCWAYPTVLKFWNLMSLIGIRLKTSKFDSIVHIQWSLNKNKIWVWLHKWNTHDLWLLGLRLWPYPFEVGLELVEQCGVRSHVQDTGILGLDGTATSRFPSVARSVALGCVLVVQHSVFEAVVRLKRKETSQQYDGKDSNMMEICQQHGKKVRNKTATWQKSWQQDSNMKEIRQLQESNMMDICQHQVNNMTKTSLREK